MKIDDIAIPVGAEVYYTQGFRDCLEDHLFYIKENVRTVANIEPMTAWRWQSDFYSLLLHMQVPVYLHWVTMRVNDMTNPNEYSPDQLQIRIVDEGIIEDIRATYKTHQVRRK